MLWGGLQGVAVSAACCVSTWTSGVEAADLTRPLLDSGHAGCSPSPLTAHLRDGDEVSTASVTSGGASCASHTVVPLHPHEVQHLHRRTGYGLHAVSTRPPGTLSRGPSAGFLPR